MAEQRFPPGVGSREHFDLRQPGDAHGAAVRGHHHPVGQFVRRCPRAQHGPRCWIVGGPGRRCVGRSAAATAGAHLVRPRTHGAAGHDPTGGTRRLAIAVAAAARRVPDGGADDVLRRRRQRLPAHHRAAPRPGACQRRPCRVGVGLRVCRVRIGGLPGADPDGADHDPDRLLHVPDFCNVTRVHPLPRASAAAEVGARAGAVGDRRRTAPRGRSPRAALADAGINGPGGTVGHLRRDVVPVRYRGTRSGAGGNRRHRRSRRGELVDGCAGHHAD